MIYYQNIIIYARDKCLKTKTGMNLVLFLKQEQNWPVKLIKFKQNTV